MNKVMLIAGLAMAFVGCASAKVECVNAKGGHGAGNKHGGKLITEMLGK